MTTSKGDGSRIHQLAQPLMAVLMLASLLSIVALVGFAAAKRRDPYWSARGALRARAGHLALPLELVHDALGNNRVHRLEGILLKLLS